MVEILVVGPGVLGPCLLGLPLLNGARLLGFGVQAWLPDLAGLLSLELGALDPSEGQGEPQVLQRSWPEGGGVLGSRWCRLSSWKA